MGKYLIQMHDASRLHYDFRLQIGAVLKSWVLPKGPSISPKERRLAILTEDHALEYGNFEGKIREGYGKGTVLLWDQGTFRNLREISLEKSFEQGQIEVWITGNKLRGGYALVHMREENWLLVKMRDAYADDELDIVKSAPRSVKSKKTLAELKKL